MAEDSQPQSPRMDREVPEETVAITTPEEATTIEMGTTEAMEAEATRTGREATEEGPTTDMAVTTVNSAEVTVDVEAIAAAASRTVEIVVTTEDIEADTEAEEMTEAAEEGGTHTKDTAPTSQAKSQAASSSISNAADLTVVAEATATEAVADTAVSVGTVVVTEVTEAAWVGHREAHLEGTDAEAEAEASEGLSDAQSTKSYI